MGSCFSLCCDEHPHHHHSGHDYHVFLFIFKKKKLIYFKRLFMKFTPVFFFIFLKIKA